MLTLDLLKGKSDTVNVSDKIKALPDDVLQELATLSKNDEDIVIGNKLKEVHDKYDKDVADATGMTKAHNERSWDFLKRSLDDLKSKGADPEIQKRLDAAETKVKDLEKSISEGKGNETMAEQLRAAQKEANDAKKEAQQWKDKHKTDLEKLTSDLETEKLTSQKTLVGAEFSKARAGLKFKAELPEDLINTFVETQEQSLLKDTTVDWIDNGQGGKIMVFRDSKREILRNKDNGLNPFTASELLQSRLGSILDSQEKKPGGGTNPPAPKPGGGGSLRISAKNQAEAIDQVREHLTAQGLKKGSEEWQTAQDKIWTESQLGDLPPQ